MSILKVLGRAGMGLAMTPETRMGTAVLAPGAAAWPLGLAVHRMLSGGIALAYVWGFEHVTTRASSGIGAAFSLVHVLVAGVGMGGGIPRVHPLVPEAMPGPGDVLANPGALGAGHVRATA